MEKVLWGGTLQLTNLTPCGTSVDNNIEGKCDICWKENMPSYSVPMVLVLDGN